MITWVDLETTGLKMWPELRYESPLRESTAPADPNDQHIAMRACDRVLEVAVIVTDDALREVGRAQWVTDEAKRSDIAALDPVVREMHSKNGLWCESLASPFSIAQVDDALANFVEKCGARGAPIAGNTIRFDREFVRRWMPRTLGLLHYRNVDVSTLTELAQRFWPEVHKGRPQGAVHRAMPDIELSIAITRYYLGKVGPTGFVAATAPDGALTVGVSNQVPIEYKR